MPILSVRNLQIQYRTARGIARAVDGATFDVPAGKVVGLIGESGCGKTTTARAVIGVIPKSASIVGGEIIFRGQDLLRLSPRELVQRRWREIAFIPQSAMNSLNPVVRVGRQVVEVLVQRGDYGRQRAHDRAAELFQMVSIDPSRLHDYPHQFSGGMRQRAVIALSLALNPALIIADEPVTALDVIVQRQVLDIFKELQVRLGLSVILVTHDISVVAYACDRVAVMYAGKVVESGPTGQVLTVPCHPYTMGLYNAFPELQQSTASLISIRGSPPSPVELPAGCRFEARCPFALPLCRNSQPVTELTAHDHEAACFRIGEAAKLRMLATEENTWRPS